MKQKILALFAVVFLFSGSAKAAATRDWGLGVILGEPTGLSAKKFSNAGRNGVDAFLSYSFDHFILVGGDYLWHGPGMWSGKGGQFFRELSPYVGIGGMLVMVQDSARHRGNLFTDDSDSDIGVAMRIPLGVEWLPSSAPVGVFVEIVPGLGLIPGMFFIVQAGIGARFYF